MLKAFKQTFAIFTQKGDRTKGLPVPAASLPDSAEQRSAPFFVPPVVVVSASEPSQQTAEACE